LVATRLDPDLSAAIFLLGSQEQNTGELSALITGADSAGARARALGEEARALQAQQRQVQRSIEARRNRSGGPTGRPS
jgi:hypothetical protein